MGYGGPETDGLPLAHIDRLIAQNKDVLLLAVVVPARGMAAPWVKLASVAYESADRKKIQNDSMAGEQFFSFPAFLKKHGYDGILTVEREITGEQQLIDIRTPQAYLKNLTDQTA